MNKGLTILTPTNSFKFGYHVDANFAGLYSFEEVMDPDSHALDMSSQ